MSSSMESRCATYERIIHRCHYDLPRKRYARLENFRQRRTSRNDVCRVEALDRIVPALDVIEIHRPRDAGPIQHPAAKSLEIGVIGKTPKIAFEKPMIG